MPKVSVEYPDYLTFRLDPGMRKRLEEMAKAEDRPVGAMVRIILREGLEARDVKATKRKLKRT